MSDWNTTEGWNSGMQGAVSGASAGSSFGPYGAIAGGIIGGVTGLFGHKKETDWNKKYFNESVRQFNIQDDYNKNRFQYTIKDALKAGVNPAAVIGSNGGHYSPTISAGGYSGGYNEQSSNFGGFMSSMADIITSRREQKQNRAIELEGAKLDLESKRLQNDILRSKLLAETQPGIPSNGQKPAIADLYIPYRTRDGKIVYRLNPDAVPDTDITNISTWQNLIDDSGSVGSWLRELVLPTKGSWNERYLPFYSVGSRFINGLIGY